MLLELVLEGVARAVEVTKTVDEGTGREKLLELLELVLEEGAGVVEVLETVDVAMLISNACCPRCLQRPQLCGSSG